MESKAAQATLFISLILFITPLQATDPYALLHVHLNPDGSLTRPKQYFPTVPPNSSALSISKDVPINPNKNTWARIYLPKTGSGRSRPGKLPVIVFAHGGGFIILSAASPKFDTLCSEAASRLHALVVSVEYRLAPEHRLPAAYDDVLEALYWIKGSRDGWIRKYGDVKRCVLMGESAGGNIAYTLGLRASNLVNQLKPLAIKGLVLIQPFFGGVKRTGSELRLVKASVLPLAVGDLLWELSLPIDANRSHVYCDPTVGGGSGKLERVRELGWRVGVVGCDGDPLFDRQVELVKLLKRQGVNVMADFSKGGYHGMFSDSPSKAEVVFKLVGRLLSPNQAN